MIIIIVHMLALKLMLHFVGLGSQAVAGRYPYFRWYDITHGTRPRSTCVQFCSITLIALSYRFGGDAAFIPPKRPSGYFQTPTMAAYLSKTPGKTLQCSREKQYERGDAAQTIL